MSALGHKRTLRGVQPKYERWARLVLEAASRLAPFQTPQLARVGVNVELAKARRDEDEPIKYPSVERIRRELALRGLPPLRDVIEAEIVEETDGET